MTDTQDNISRLWGPSERPNYIVDWDSTFCQKETLDFLAQRVLGAEALKAFQAFTDRGMEGNLPFGESLSKRLAMLRVHHEQVLEVGEELADHLDPTALARRSCIEKNQDRIYIVSGGFEELILPSSSRLGIRDDHVHANRFTYDSAGFVTGADPARLTCQDGGKAAQVAALEIDGLKVAVGDGHNDYLIKALGCADIFIAYTRHQTRESVIPLADAVVDSFAEPLLT